MAGRLSDNFNDEVEQLDDDPALYAQEAKMRSSRTFVNPSNMVFPLSPTRNDHQFLSENYPDQIVTGHIEEHAALSDDDDGEDIRNNYQWSSNLQIPKSLMLPQNASGGEFELHVQHFDDLDQVQQEESFDSNMVPINKQHFPATDPANIGLRKKRA